MLYHYFFKIIVKYINKRILLCYTMQIEIAKDTSKKINNISKLLGIKKNELIDKAILLYLDSISKYLDLKQEMKEWDILSDEALLNFETLEMQRISGHRNRKAVSRESL